MCGIAGYVDLRDHRSPPESVLRAMTDALAHRGPDGSNVWRMPGVGLGHRRLAIIDLAGGIQPMASADGQCIIVFNGEIYNYRDVRRDLEARGRAFRTNSDTEVILAAWAEYGEACVTHLRGMFAFALWDAPTRRLFLARDRLGVKPLYYAMLPDGGFIFGSELKALLAYPRLPRDIDVTAVEDYFAYGYIPDPKSILAGVRKLSAGHTLTLERGKPVEPRRYWDLDFTTRHQGSPETLADELIARMREAVKLRLVADVPVGAFLSGGVDSSAVVALMAGLTDSPVNSCSIGFDVEALDETGYAGRVAERYATAHRARTVSADDFGLIDRLVQGFDEPFADASALPTLRVSELAREQVKVALSGDGADEALAGYRRYRMHGLEDRLRGFAPERLRRSLFAPLGAVFPKLDWAPRSLRAKTTFEALGMSSEQAYFNSISVTPDRLRQQLFTPAFRRELQGHWAGSLYVDTMRAAPASDSVGRAQYADMMHWLSGDILTKVDRMSMAVGLEAREPLLDHQLVEWCAGLPLAMRIRGAQGKWLMKKALEPYLPADILYRPKMGFVVPIAHWFRGPLAARVDAMVAGGMLANSGWIDPAFVRKAALDHREGRADHGRLLWQLLMFDLSVGRLLTLPERAAA